MVAGVTSPGRPVDLSLGVAERGRGGDGSGAGPRQGARVRRRGQIEAQRKSEGLPALRRVRDPAASWSDSVISRTAAPADPRAGRQS